MRKMKIEHIAIWVGSIDTTRNFYMKYFNVTSNEKYTNPAKGFSSYFLSFATGARFEIMQKTAVINSTREYSSHYMGFAHFAISVGSNEKVDSITNQLSKDGYQVLDGPRKTGDGYYESCVLDCDGNIIEITI
jgi:lactoylglutathione lyase